MIILRPSSIGQIMGEPRSKAAKEAGELSETAKTYLNQLAKEQVYGYRKQIDNKYMQKGRMVEDDSISLFNLVFGTDYEKHVGRIETDLLSGECDIKGDDLIIDIKSSWSLDTFPATPEDGKNDDYEWQGRAYMHLYDKPKFDLAYCLVSTPDELCKYESPDAHCVDHIPVNMRVTVLHFDRDMALEQKMLDRARRAQQYVLQQIERIKSAHQF